jgi:dipeptidyl aminopeptidase/acylaminoacyl peptidase
MPLRSAVSAIVVPLLVACNFLGGGKDESPVVRVDESTSVAASPSETAPSSAAFSMPSTPHPVSLPALMEKEYDGRDLRLGDVLGKNAAYARYAITYKSGDLTISGILNLPAGDGSFPVLILNHGYIDPAVYTTGRGLKREQDYLARRGYAVLHPDYRNHAGSSKDPLSDVNLRIGYVEDVINAIHAVRSSGIPQLDGSRVGMLGHSMGGGITTNVLVAQPELVKAAVLFAPVSSDMVQNYERWLKDRPDVVKAVDAVYGSPENNPEFWDNVSSKTFLDRVAVPVMIHQGSADKDVPVEWARDLDARLRAEGKDVTYHEYPAEPHEFTTAWPTVMARTAEFFDGVLK